LGRSALLGGFGIEHAEVMLTETLRVDSGVGRLADTRYLSLTTFRRDGTPVACPVWVVSDDGRRLLVVTGAQTGKVKRLRCNSRVLVAPSNGTGKLRGDQIEGRGRLFDPADRDLIERLIREKYGLWVPFVQAFYRVGRFIRRQPPPEPAYIEIVDVG
jgi:PPOX class probable F420-dependent enzyme